jgi:hypothetical protein
MVKVTPSIRSQVIEKHLYGHSLGQIAKEIGGISKTAAYNIVQDWNSKVSSLNIDDIRIFLSNIGRSGITIEECVQGYRTAQILKQFGVMDDELEKWIFEDEEIEDEERSEKQNPDTHYKKEFSIGLKSPNPDSLLPRLQKENKNSTVKTYQFSYFTESIYNNCKNRNIKPSIIVRWIEDLFSFYSISFNQSIDDSIYKYSNTDQKNINEEEFQSSGLNKKYDNEIPFISNVTNFIKVKKKNLEYLDNKKNLISNDIAFLEKQRMERKSELNKVVEKEKKAYSYFSWYNNLRHNLFKKYNILIEQEIDLFANALQDFKQYHFAATKILSEYKTIDSLRRERKQIQDELQQKILTRNNILKEINSLEDRSNYYQQTIKIYQGLHKEGMGLKELKQLNYIVMESHLENGLEVKDSIKKFLKDVEDQYDNKLGFEKKINELKAEMKKLEEQVPEYQSYLKLQGIVSPTLIHLTYSGVTNEDIIGMNHLVLEFKNSDFLSDPIDKNSYHSNTKTNDSIIKSQYWNVFVEKLKELKNINTEINKQASSLNNLKSQISDLITNKQQIENVYSDSVNNLNKVITKTLQFLGMARQISESTSKNILPVVILVPVLVDFDSSHDNDPDETQERQ